MVGARWVPHVLNAQAEMLQKCVESTAGRQLKTDAQNALKVRVKTKVQITYAKQSLRTPHCLRTPH